jgi:hypothetical protein
LRGAHERHHSHDTPVHTARVPQGGYDDTLPLRMTMPDDTAFSDDEERLARRKQRRREAIGALLAVFWLLVAIGLFAGIVYGAYYFWKKRRRAKCVCRAISQKRT